MSSGDRDLKRKEEAAASVTGNLNKIQAMANLPGLSATKAATAEEEEAQPSSTGAVKKRKKLVKKRLPQELVEEIMRRPVRVFRVIPDELLAGFSEECRAAFLMQKADVEELMALDADIIRQYKDTGYAEVEEEVTDSEEEEKVKD